MDKARQDLQRTYNQGDRSAGRRLVVQTVRAGENPEFNAPFHELFQPGEIDEGTIQQVVQGWYTPFGAVPNGLVYPLWNLSRTALRGMVKYVTGVSSPVPTAFVFAVSSADRHTDARNALRLNEGRSFGPLPLVCDAGWEDTVRMSDQGQSYLDQVLNTEIIAQHPERGIIYAHLLSVEHYNDQFSTRANPSPERMRIIWERVQRDNDPATELAFVNGHRKPIEMLRAVPPELKVY